MFLTIRARRWARSGLFVVTIDVRGQYERFPYPPVPWIALPARRSGQGLSFEFGRQLTSHASPIEVGQPRILIAGCGTFEPIVAALANPTATEIVAVDFSAAALVQLDKRLKYARAVGRWSPARRAALRVPFRMVHHDLSTWEGGEFDYIIASNVIHHVFRPQELLARMAQWLRPGGLLRLVTYPKHSRLWIRWTRAWLELCGIGADDPRLVRRARSAIRQLDPSHPIRSCYAAHGETRTATGIVDAFLHRCENPLSPLQWREAARHSGLVLGAEAQHDLSRSSFLRELAPRTAQLDPWRCLQILDDLCELAASPVYWLVKSQISNQGLRADVNSSHDQTSPPAGENALALHGTLSPDSLDLGEQPKKFQLPSAMYAEMGAGLRRASAALSAVDVGLEEVLDRLREEVGERSSRRFPHRRLPGLTVNEYDRAALLRAAEPWNDQAWQRVQQRFPQAHIFYNGIPVKGGSLARQALRLQLEQGPFAPELEIELATNKDNYV